MPSTMAAATVVTTRPPQTLRRRESNRPSQAKPARINTAASMEISHREVSTIPFVRDSKYILKKFAGRPPSLVIHLHATYFRLENQEDTFPYDSPMKLLIQHLKEQTLPHDMLEELYEAGVPFYEGCLIVEVHDHKSTGPPKPSKETVTINDDGNKPFSIHNHNDFTTPSPFVPYPEKKQGTDEANGTSVKKEGDVDGSEDADAPGERDDVSEQNGTSQQKSQAPARIFTIVLHPTGRSKDADMRLLANTPMPDAQTARRQQSLAGRNSGTPTMPHPPTPLTSVPPTPLLSVKSPKRPRMVIDDHNRFEFEAEMLLRTTPRLFLEPTRSLDESMQLIDSMTHPNHKHSPPPPRKRKRTTAELAADEADAAAQQRFMLVGDDRKSSAVAADNEEGQAGMRGGAFEPRFSRFKTLETIRGQYEERERRKREEEARQAHHRKQLQAQQKEEQARREEEQARATEQERILAQRREQQARMRMNMQQAANNSAAQFAQVTAANTQAQQAGSPIVRQQTPMAAPSPGMGSVTTSTHPMSGVSMVATSSNQGLAAGSPPRPASAVSHQGGQIQMARQVSQQHPQQVPSRNGTPQLVQGTPQLNTPVPINRNMTPQPRVNAQGSPAPGAMQNAAMMGQQMMGNPQLQNMTPEQIAFQRQRMAHMQAQRQAQAQMQNNMGSSPHQMTPEQQQQQQQQLMMMRAQSQAGQQGMQNPAQQYQQQLARQMSSQMGTPGGQDSNVSPSHPQMRAQQLHPGLQTMIRQYQEQKMRFQQQFPTGLPHNVQAQLQNFEQRIRAAQQQIVRQQATGGQSNMAAAAQGMGQVQIPANLPPGVSPQQYVAMVQQRQQQALRQQQQQLMMRQMQAQQQQQQQQQGQNQQMNMGNMGNMAGMNMGNMQAMGNMQGMQNMMNMQGNPNMNNMQTMWMNQQGQGRGQGMGGHGMGGMGGQGMG